MALRPLDPSIVNFYQPPKLNMPDPLQDVVALEQIKNLRAQREIRDQDLALANESKTYLTNIQNKIAQAGGPENVREHVPQMLVHPNPTVRKAGETLQEHIDRVDRLAEYAKLNPEDQPVAPTTGAVTSRVAPLTVSMLETRPEGAAPGAFLNAPRGVAGVTVGTAERGGNVSPAAAATSNALIPDTFKQQIQNELARAEKFARYYETQAARDPKEFKDAAKQARDNVNSLRKMQSFGPNQFLLMGGESMVTPSAPEGTPAEQRMFDAYMNMTPAQQAAFDKFRMATKPTTNINVSATNTPAGKSLAEPVGKLAAASLGKAEGATEIMNAANSVRDALNTGNVIAGPGAGIRTKFAQVLEMAGVGDKEKLTATRTAIQGMADLTLQSRAELKGQGQITDAETKLLERARSGDIADMTIAELQTVVNVSQRLAGRLWSNHQTLLGTMREDPAARDVYKYYTPTAAMPQAIGEGKSSSQQAKEDKRPPLKDIFGAKKP
jgi:hypothetical protein